MTEKSLTLQLSLDQQLTDCEAPSERILEIALLAPQDEQHSQRPPLNLAMVLDRSGSMSGEKLQYVKLAAQHVLELLQDPDRAALVQYDDNVDVLFHSAPILPGIKPGLLQAVKNIRSGGSTNLSGGWLTGCQELAKSQMPQTLNRALLLTDGLANVGITDPAQLATHAMELASRGIATSTFGVGYGFNHELLEAMAIQGEGRFHFIEHADDIPNIFALEMEELGAVYAREIEVTLCCPPGCQLAVSGEWRNEPIEPGKLRIKLGSLCVGKSKEVYIRLSIPAMQEGQQIPVTVNVLAKGQVQAENDMLITLTSETTLRAVSLAEAEAAPRNEQVLERFARVDLADKAAEALKLEQRGEREMAGTLLQQSLQANINHIDADLSDRYRSMSDRMRTGMDEIDRKRSHYDTHSQRRRSREAERFPLKGNVLGHLVMDVDGHLVLLDTGSPVSIGFREDWHFMGRHLHFQSDYLGVTIDYLRKVIQAPVDFMLGMDTLMFLNIAISTKLGEVSVSRDYVPDLAVTIPLEFVMGVPAASFQIAGAARKMFVDTSAKLSYLAEKALAGYERVDTEKDFYPGYGEFETDVYQVPLELGAGTVMLRCGVLPKLLATALMVSGAEGILGTELYNYYEAAFAFHRQMLTLGPR